MGNGAEGVNFMIHEHLYLMLHECRFTSTTKFMRRWDRIYYLFICFIEILLFLGKGKTLQFNYGSFQSYHKVCRTAIFVVFKQNAGHIKHFVGYKINWSSLSKEILICTVLKPLEKHISWYVDWYWVLCFRIDSFGYFFKINSLFNRKIMIVINDFFKST